MEHYTVISDFTTFSLNPTSSSSSSLGYKKHMIYVCWGHPSDEFDELVGFSENVVKSELDFTVVSS